MSDAPWTISFAMATPFEAVSKAISWLGIGRSASDWGDI
jgi:hypothetical protein